jgi:osmotically-inducible protein OsmY
MANHSSDDKFSELKAALERDPRIDVHHHPLHAFLDDGRLVLEGSVKNVAAMKLAYAAALRTMADVPVVDRLRVAAAEPREDGALRDDVCHRLLEESVFLEYGLRASRNGAALSVLREPLGEGGYRIDIQVAEGTVTLSGSVGSLSHLRLAEVLVWWTAGCERVQNRLEVSPPERDTNDELADAILLVLEKDPLVHANQLATVVKEGTVTVKGYLSSEEEKHLAVMDVWCVPGVRDVIDEIVTKLQG